MRKLKLIEHISLDGVIQSSNENHFPYTDWTAPYRSPAGLQTVLDLQGENFDLLLGRTTYDMWSQYWPKAPKGPMSDKLNAATKYVFTHHPQTLEWGPFEGVGPDITEAIKSIKAKKGPDLILWGSSTLSSKLLELGLADEVSLIVYPVLIGTGKRFFAEGTAACKLALEKSQTSPTGVLLNSYKFVGSLQNQK